MAGSGGACAPQRGEQISELTRKGPSEVRETDVDAPDRAGAAGRSCVILIEPRPMIRAGLSRELRGLRMEPITISAELLGAGLHALAEGAGWTRPLLIADGDGVRSGVRALRRAGHRNPVLVYQDFRRSERATDLLDAGADCVLTLPLRGVELEARILAIQRRAHGHADAEVRSGHLTVPLDRRPASVDGEPIRLTDTEGALLRHLALNLDRPVSRDHLYEFLYEATESKPFVRILDRFICNIRQGIAELWPDGGRTLRTLPGYGYMFVSTDTVEPRSELLQSRAKACDMRKI